MEYLVSGKEQEIAMAWIEKKENIFFKHWSDNQCNGPIFRVMSSKHRMSNKTKMTTSKCFSQTDSNKNGHFE